MERVYGSDVDRHPADLAHHLFQAGTASDPEKTGRFLTLAGGLALEAGAFVEAMRQFDDALSIQGKDDEEGRRKVADLRYKKGQALRSIGRGRDAVAEWREALTGFAALHDDEAIARTACTAYSVWYALAYGGDPGAARQEVERGLAALGADAAAERCLLLTLAGLSFSLEGKPGGAGPIEQSVSLAENIGDDRLLADVLHQKGWHHHHHLQTHDALEALRRAEAVLRSTSSQYDLADVMTCIDLVETYVGNLEEVAKLSEELEPLAARVGNEAAFNWARLCRAWGEVLSTGDLDVAERFAWSEVERQSNFGWRVLVQHFLGAVLTWRGQWPQAELVYQDAVDEEPESFFNHSASSALLLLKAQSGDAVSAQELRQVKVTLPQHGSDHLFGVWEQLLNVVEGLAVLGERKNAAGFYPQVVKGLENGVVISLNSRLWQMVAGIAAACGQHWDAAQEHYETALKQAHDLPHKIAQPEVRRWYARMLLDRNAADDRDKARTMLTEAIEMYEQIGMPRHIEMAKDTLKSL